MTLQRDSLLRIGQMGLFATAALLSVLSVAALASRGDRHKQLAALVKRYVPAEKADEKQEESKSAAKDKAKNPPKDKGKAPKKSKLPLDQQVARILKRHLFSPAPPKKGFSAKLTGVLGEEAFFDGGAKGHKVGQSYKGAKIKQIGADWAELDFEGKAKKLYVFGADSGRPSPPGPARPPGARHPGMRRPSPGPRARPGGLTPTREGNERRMRSRAMRGRRRGRAMARARASRMPEAEAGKKRE